MKAVVLGASSGLGRSIAIGLGARGHDVALMGRRTERLEGGVAEIGDNAHAITCDVTDEAICRAAVEQAAETLGGIDTLVYATGVGTVGRMKDLDAASWTHTLATNVVGAAVATAAALPHLQAAEGSAIFLSSVSASMTTVWPGLGAYITSKAALDKMIEAWRVEHPEVGFTRLIVGDCGGGDGESGTEFSSGWDMDLATEFATMWFEKGYIAGALVDVEELVSTVDHLMSTGSSVVVPSVAVLPRVPRPEG